MTMTMTKKQLDIETNIANKLDGLTIGEYALRKATAKNDVWLNVLSKRREDLGDTNLPQLSFTPSDLIYFAQQVVFITQHMTVKVPIDKTCKNCRHNDTNVACLKGKRMWMHNCSKWGSNDQEN